MEIEEKRTIPVVFAEPASLVQLPDEAEPTLGPEKSLARAGRFVTEVPVDQLHQSLKNLTAGAKGALQLTFRPPAPR
ncbi:MAG: hypothetical protein EA424_02670 [Planctomycetaceae bacterium]|nr:MAG: hypothetical protein EA424_02670 [Planctomycetaceae bacterium]